MTRSIEQMSVYRKGDAHRRSHSIPQKVGCAGETRRSRVIQQKTSIGRIQMHVWGRLRSSSRERERRDTSGLTANNDHICGVERLCGLRRGGVPEARRQNSLQRKTGVNTRFTRSARSRFTKRQGRVLTSTASRRRLERCMQHSADER